MAAFNCPARRKEIDAALNGRMDKSSITRHLSEAKSLGLLVNPKRGIWSALGTATFPGADGGVRPESPLIEESPGLVN